MDVDDSGLIHPADSHSDYVEAETEDESLEADDVQADDEAGDDVQSLEGAAEADDELGEFFFSVY